VASGLDGGHGLIERGEARSVRGLDILSASGLLGLALALASPVRQVVADDGGEDSAHDQQERRPEERCPRFARDRQPRGRLDAVGGRGHAGGYLGGKAPCYTRRMTDTEHLDQMHPWLRERVEAAVADWRASAAEGDTIRIVESVRSLATQQGYYLRGKSRADGVDRYSLHQFAPALAADVAVLRDGKYVTSAADGAWQRWGAAAKAHGLEWGGDWRGLVDAPHVQAAEAQRVRLLQLAVGAVPDGLWGPATEAAIRGRGGVLREGRGWARVTPSAWAKVLA
jgi:hypothetical protein